MFYFARGQMREEARARNNPPVLLLLLVRYLAPFSLGLKCRTKINKK